MDGRGYHDCGNLALSEDPSLIALVERQTQPAAEGLREEESDYEMEQDTGLEMALHNSRERAGIYVAGEQQKRAVPKPSASEKKRSKKAVRRMVRKSVWTLGI